jgi:hypothetical protein
MMKRGYRKLHNSPQKEKWAKIIKHEVILAAYLQFRTLTSETGLPLYNLIHFVHNCTESVKEALYYDAVTKFMSSQK